MTLDQLRKLLNEDAPLVIHLVSGREFHVPHTDYVALSQNGSSLSFWDAKNQLEIIRTATIESITVENRAA
jgi:hypothetical protein